MAANEVDPSELLSSPINSTDPPKTPRTPKTPTPGGNNTNRQGKKPFDAEEVHEAALRRELEGVRNINEVIEGVIATLERAKGNMGVRASYSCSSATPLAANTDPNSSDRLTDRDQRIHPPEYLDSNPFPD